MSADIETSNFTRTDLEDRIGRLVTINLQSQLAFCEGDQNSSLAVANKLELTSRQTGVSPFFFCREDTEQAVQQSK